MEVEVMIDLEDVIDTEGDTLERDYGISAAVVKDVKFLASAVLAFLDGSCWNSEKSKCLHIAMVLEDDAKKFRKHARAEG